MSRIGKILFILSLFVTSWVTAQQTDIPFDKRLFEDKRSGFEEAVKEIKMGDFYFFNGSNDFLMQALAHFLSAQEFNPFSSILNYKIGICYLYSLNKPKSLPHLEFANRVNPDLDNDLKLYLAQAHQICEEFETAIHYYKIYKGLISVNDWRQHAFIDKKISESENGLVLSKKPIRVWIDNLGDSINSEFSEFSPVISADNRVLFYTARRPDSYGEKKDRSGKFFEDIYYSNRGIDSDWEQSRNIGSPINTESHDATVGIAPDGKSILTYQGVSSKNGDILITKQLPDNTWEAPTSIGSAVNSKHHESSASLSFDEKTLYFVSDRPGGYGQHDIYVSYWDEEKKAWGMAENLGSRINTDFEEMGVFFHADSKTLYFSSNGHDNIGGLDVFKTIYDPISEEWSTPQNIGIPINTPDDDIYFVVTGNNRYAYYSSSRPGGFGEKDIYKITFLGDKKVPAIPSIVSATPNMGAVEIGEMIPTLKPNEAQFLLTGKITDGETKNGIQGELYIVNALTNQKVRTISTYSDGSFSAVLKPGEQYALTAAGNHLTIASKTLHTDETFNGELATLNFELYPPSADSTSGHSFALRNIYFGFDQTNLDYSAFDSQAQVELDLLAKLLSEYPTIRIELSGHTDRRGSNNYNLNLSLNRALIAKQYLIEKGIKEERILTIGLGETQPEITWSEIKEMTDKKEREDAHQKNRRTVVTILSK